MIHLLGIRHHGPGSARHVRSFLERTKPDIILVEGPPEANGLLQYAIHKEMQPPVAILAFAPENLKLAAFYPFAHFSPEWQAMVYGVNNLVPVRFFDLPLTHKFAIDAAEQQKAEEAAKAAAEQQQVPEEKTNTPEPAEITAETAVEEIRKDPLSWLGEIAGFDDGERWWDQFIEHRQNDEDVFTAVNEAMSALRQSLPEKDDAVEKLREAHMRQMIRQAQKEKFENIVVVCGAWHVPAMDVSGPEKDDKELLKNLPKIKVDTTWVPWTYDRLSFDSGYGAGIHSPGWYAHVWDHAGDDGTLWMSKVAQLFRSKNMDTSTAHVIEAVRLGEAITALRGFSTPGLEEMNEATMAVLCGGDDVLLQLVRRELIVGNVIGNVPGDVPRPPLQRDIEMLQKKLRLKPISEEKAYEFDLREALDLERSVFLHRLELLNIAWGKKGRSYSKGTFKENWVLKWEPGLSVIIIEKGSWGNTTAEAAANFVMYKAGEAQHLKEVAELLEAAIPADLPEVSEKLLHHINNLAAATGDVLQLMESLPPLVNVSRYGDVRKTDTTMLLSIVKTMVTRICISLPSACTSIDDDAAQQLLGSFTQLNEAVSLLQDAEQLEQWHKTLDLLSGSRNTAPVLAGYSTRLLQDHNAIGSEELEARFTFALSKANEALAAAAWLEGFLKGAGNILLLDNQLWNLVNGWVAQIDDPSFDNVLPLMRRAFSALNAVEKRKIGEKARGIDTQQQQEGSGEINTQRAATVLPLMAQLLGIKPTNA